MRNAVLRAVNLGALREPVLEDCMNHRFTPMGMLSVQICGFPCGGGRCQLFMIESLSERVE